MTDNNRAWQNAKATPASFLAQFEQSEAINPLEKFFDKFAKR